MRSTEVDHVLTQLAAVSRTENAKGSYEFVRDVEQADRIVVPAPYGDTAEREHHRTTEHFTRIGACPTHCVTRHR